MLTVRSVVGVPGRGQRVVCRGGSSAETVGAVVLVSGADDSDPIRLRVVSVEHRDLFEVCGARETVLLLAPIYGRRKVHAGDLVWLIPQPDAKTALLLNALEVLAADDCDEAFNALVRYDEMLVAEAMK